MTTRWRVRRAISRAIRLSKGDGKTAIEWAAKLSVWRDNWKLLPIPQEYQVAHQYDFTDEPDSDFLEEVLQVWDLYPNLRDAICSIVGVRTVSDHAERSAIWAFVVSIISLIVSLIGLRK